MGAIKKLRQKLPDPLDVWGGKAEQARKDAKEQAALDRRDMQNARNSMNAPTMDSAAVTAAREEERKRRAQAAGQGSTILTGANGLAGGATTSGKTLLGQ
jgi:uncharacterized membrane protein